jgi:tetratricopeptide (TPR) repeat protein
LGVEAAILHDTDVGDALDFIEKQYRKAVGRKSSPADLLADALKAREAGYWAEALALLDEGKSMFRRRDWRREDPLYFEILLVLAGTEMQIGAEELRPKVPANILRSVTRQRLGGARADLVKAQAHYIAALIYNQKNDPRAIRKVLDNLERARELLRGRTDRIAVREYWRYSSYLELTKARLTGYVRPESSSAILQAGRVIEESYHQKQMRYGEALLHAGRPAEAIKYIQPAIESDRLATPAVVIAERLAALAKWKAGTGPGPTLDALEGVEQSAEALGFAHQVRLIRQAMRRVRRARRT